MNWRRRYALNEMWQHFRDHVMTPAEKFVHKTKQGLDYSDITSEDPLKEEIKNCKFCQHPEYMAWEHGQIFGAKSNALMNPDERDVAGHYHIDNHLNAGSTCILCNNKKWL